MRLGKKSNPENYFVQFFYAGNPSRQMPVTCGRESAKNVCKSRIGNKECSNLMQKCCKIDAKMPACQIEYCQQKNKTYLKNNSVRPIITAVTTVRKCKKNFKSYMSGFGLGIGTKKFT